MREVLAQRSHRRSLSFFGQFEEEASYIFCTSIFGFSGLETGNSCTWTFGRVGVVSKIELKLAYPSSCPKAGQWLNSQFIFKSLSFNLCLESIVIYWKSDPSYSVHVIKGVWAIYMSTDLEHCEFVTYDSSPTSDFLIQNPTDMFFVFFTRLDASETRKFNSVALENKSVHWPFNANWMSLCT